MSVFSTASESFSGKLIRSEPRKKKLGNEFNGRHVLNNLKLRDAERTISGDRYKRFNIILIKMIKSVLAMNKARSIPNNFITAAHTTPAL